MSVELQRFIKFCLVGVTNTLIDLGFFNLFIFFGINIYIASSCSFLASTVNSYLLNRSWTFKDKKSDRPVFQYAQFLVVSTIGLIFNNAIVYSFDLAFGGELTTLWLNIAKLTAIVCVVVWNYGSSRFFVFKTGKS